jgi:uncharacterized membrane protein
MNWNATALKRVRSMSRLLPSHSRLLTVSYTFEMLALAIWIGGLVVIVASVIPAVFNTIGMESGGRFLGRVFNGYNHLIAVAIVVLVASGVWRLYAGTHGLPEAQLARSELLLMTAMIAIACVIALVLAPKTIQLQEAAFAAKSKTAQKVAYDAFFESHRIVRVLYITNLGLAVALTAVKIQRWLVGRSGGNG